MVDCTRAFPSPVSYPFKWKKIICTNSVVLNVIIIIILTKGFVRNSWKIESRWCCCGGGRPATGGQSKGGGEPASLAPVWGKQLWGMWGNEGASAWNSVDWTVARIDPPRCGPYGCVRSGRGTGGGRGRGAGGLRGVQFLSGKSPGAGARPSSATLRSQGRWDSSETRCRRRLCCCSHPAHPLPASPTVSFRVAVSKLQHLRQQLSGHFGTWGWESGRELGAGCTASAPSPAATATAADTPPGRERTLSRGPRRPSTQG